MKHNLVVPLCLLLTTAIGQPAPQPVTVPFMLIGHTILVEAVVNGRSGHFILDTGAPKIFLNSAYYEGVKIPWQNEAVMDVNGLACEVLHSTVKELTLAGRSLSGSSAYVADLKGLENSKGLPIAGILGHPAFMDTEILFDFDKRHLLLLPLDKKGKRTCTSPTYTLIDSLDMKMSGHFPCVMAEVGGRKLRLGIDTGAEVNVFHEKVLNKQDALVEETGEFVLKGMKSRSKTCRSGKLRALKVGHLELEHTKVVITDLGFLNEHLTTQLDGMLGVPFLMQGKMAFNYKQKKLYLWEDAPGVAADNSQISKVGY